MKSEITELLNKLRTKDDIMHLAKIADQNQECFDTLWEIVQANNQPISWYACWVLSHATVAHTSFLEPYISILYELVPQQTHPGMKREMFKLLIRLDIDEEKCTHMMDTALQWLQNPKEAIAVRAQSIHYLMKILELEPEFKYELEAILLQLLNEDLSAGLKNTTLKSLRRIEKMG